MAAFCGIVLSTKIGFNCARTNLHMHSSSGAVEFHTPSCWYFGRIFLGVEEIGCVFEKHVFNFPFEHNFAVVHLFTYTPAMYLYFLILQTHFSCLHGFVPFFFFLYRVWGKVGGFGFLSASMLGACG